MKKEKKKETTATENGSKKRKEKNIESADWFSFLSHQIMIK